ncbi:MAG: hypothetical protein GY771_07445 [bacterium]|nr:hypothetical protein [bacterium]
MNTNINIVWSKQTLSAARKTGGEIISLSWHGLAPDIGVAYGEELMPRDWGDDVYIGADALAKGWYRGGETEYLRLKGMAFGAVPKTDMFHFFVEHLRVYQVAEAIISEYGVNYRVFDDGSRYFYLISNVFAALGAEVEMVKAGSFNKVFGGDWFKRRFHWPLAYIHYQRKYRMVEAESGFNPAGEAIPEDAVLYICQLRASEADYFNVIAGITGLPYYFAALRPDTLGKLCKLRLPGRGVYDWLPPKKGWRDLNFELIKSYREMVNAGGPFFGDYFNSRYADFVRDDFTYKPQTYLVHLTILYASVTAMLENVKPAAVVHTSDAHPTGFIASRLAKERGIPTINVQNGITGGVPSYAYLPLSSGLTCCWGEHSRDWMTAGGADPEGIKPVGSPLAYQFEKKLGNTDASKIKNKLGLSGVVILVATNDFDRVQNRYMLLAALDVARERPEWTFLFRPHPAETGEVQEGLLEAADLPNARLDTGDLAELSSILDGAIIGHSGIGVDLLIAGVPTVYVNFMSVPDYLPYADMGAMLSVGNKDDIGPALDEAVSVGADAFADGVAEFKRLYLGDYRNAYRNIAEEIARICNGG